MLACKGIFATPSMAQPRFAREGRSPTGLRSKTVCGHYSMDPPKKQIPTGGYQPPASVSGETSPPTVTPV